MWLTSVLPIEAPPVTMILLLLLRIRPSPFSFGEILQVESTVMSEPSVAVPAAGHAASARLPKASSGATATAVSRTLRINETL